MSYIETHRQGKKEYYYLTKNIRVSPHKWRKIRIFIGNKKPSAKEVSRLAGKIEKEAKAYAPALKYPCLSEHDAETLQDLKQGYAEWLKHTPKSVKDKLNEDFVIRFTYHSNAIEGNRLTLRQTALILKDKVIPSGVSAEDYNEAINGRECLEFIKAYKGEINTRLLEKVNGILTKNTGVMYGGRVRFFDVQIFGSNHKPPGHTEVKRHLLNLIKWYSANKSRLHPFELAAIIHAKIAWIHPFEDGNGRTARAIMNLILIKKGFPMFFIPIEKRENYYRAIEFADKGDYKGYAAGMLQLVIDQVRSYGHSKK